MSRRFAWRGRLGLALAALAFVGSAWHVFTSARPESGGVTLRVGHWLIHTGMRESFDEAARAYERLHPGVKIEQIAVPLRSWSAWVRTQLIGGTAPDITGQLGLNEEVLSRHFLPLDDALDEPNPYNAGGPLAGVPWRDTFNDGLASMRALNPNSGEITGVYLQLTSLRFFYNKDLLRRVTGSDAPPATYAELRALREKVDRYNAARGTRIEPIAGCGPYAQFLFQRLLPSQTQKLAATLSPTRNLRVESGDLAALMLDGRVDYRSPELRSSLELMRDVSSLMGPGFLQLQRDDALFTYLQQNALAIVAGTWDYAVFARETKFETGVAPVPLPDRHDPRFGSHTLGPVAEGGGGSEGMLGVVRSSPNAAVALDFLKFLTSHAVAARFTELSKRVSAIVDVPPPRDAPGLAPRLDGEAPGFGIDFQFFGASNTYTLFQRHAHALVGERGDVDAFLDRFEPELREALGRDLAFQVARARRDAQRLDARIGVMLSLPDASADPDEVERLFEALALRQSEQLRHSPHARP